MLVTCHNYPFQLPVRSLLVTALYQCLTIAVIVHSRAVRETASAKTSSVIRSRGFLAEDHYITTPDGYILNLVRATNPLINNGHSGSANKEPILFIHGVLSNCNSFLVNSDDAKPANYADREANLMGDTEWQQLVSTDGTTKSLAFTALNFGHEIWLLNRRGTSASLGHTDTSRQAYHTSQATISSGEQRSTVRPNVFNWFFSLLSARGRLQREEVGDVNPKYWYFSLDLQVKFDIPMTLDYVLNYTNRPRISVVAFSSGGSLTLMLLSERPELASKISKAALWAPALRFEGKLQALVARISIAAFSSYIGPFPKPELDPPLRNTIATLCQPSIFRDTLCNGISDLIAGRVGNQQVLPKNIQIVLDSSSSGEVIQLLQAEISGKMHYFDYNNSTMNYDFYGQPYPPLYDVSKVKLDRVAFWGGGADNQVPISTLESLIQDMSIPVERHYLNQTGIRFNHYSFIYHRYVAELLNIPTLRFLESR